jgi:hypothetical protein
MPASFVPLRSGKPFTFSLAHSGSVGVRLNGMLVFGGRVGQIMGVQPQPALSNSHGRKLAFSTDWDPAFFYFFEAA